MDAKRDVLDDHCFSLPFFSIAFDATKPLRACFYFRGQVQE
jgi:hypothetical protein